MNDPKEQQEPSMEEILASIRRIISEDDEGEEGGEEAAQDAPEAEASEGESEDASEEASEEASADDIDALMADAGPEAADEAPADEEASADDIDALMADAGPKPTGDNDDVLELTEEVQDDGTVVDLDAKPDAAEEDEDVELEAVDIEPPAAAAPVAAPGAEGLVAAPIAAEATSTFAGFASAVEQGRLASSQGIGGRTVEEVVKEVIRPIVKEWLDENLAALVERLVSREIDRMSRRAEDQIPE